MTIKIHFARTHRRLTPYIAGYYHMHFDYPRIEDIQRADIGYLRFMLSGAGNCEFAGGKRYPDHPVTLLGPMTEAARYSLEGPLDSFGCILRPAFWGGIVDDDALSFTNRLADAVPLFGPSAQTLYDAIKASHDIAAMAALADAFFVPKIKPLPPHQSEIITAIGDWLSKHPITAPDKLYGACAHSPRQVTRYANRFFGAPPKMLARKSRALRTASKIIGTKGQVPDHLVNDYADRAHMTREIKHFTGITPRGLQTQSCPIMKITLQPNHYRTVTRGESKPAL